MREPEKFFSNRECSYFPCHKGVSREDFNCLFCYCPLYFMGQDCGGDFIMKDGIKSCINCARPHVPDNFDEINETLKNAVRNKGFIQND